MIIGNNTPNNNFNNQHRKSEISNSSMNNTYENRWNEINKYNQQRPVSKNVFVKDIKEQKYSNASNTKGMQDKTLAMLHERLEQGTISLEEFNKKCAILGQQRQNITKRNKVF